MKLKVFTSLLLLISLNLFGQQALSEDCYKIKYLDFFGLESQPIVKWPESEISGLMATDFEKNRSDQEIRTNFIIPVIVYQLKEYHPDCNPTIDTAYFNQISKLYFRIRDIDATDLSDKSIAERIDFIRTDFYQQVENDKFLPHMIMTFDDGPFYGSDIEDETTLNPTETQETNFGSLEISKVGDQSILTGTDKKGDILWQKSITGLSDRILSDLRFTENPMDYSSVATIANMYSEGERFTLFLKKDGNFMFYFHSW